MKEQIATFFDDYAARFNASLQNPEQDTEGTAADFAECFLESAPGRLRCSHNDDAFKGAVPAVFTHYRSIGLQHMKICSKTITLLDPIHALVKIHWQSLYIRSEGNKAEMGFDAHYLVRCDEGHIRIFASMSGNEQQ